MVMIMDMNKSQYKKYVEKKAQNSPILKNSIMAFLVGGAICTLGELLMKMYIYFGFEKLDAGALTSVSLVFLSAFLTSVGIYDKIAKHAGAGTLVPITGFANAVVSPAIEFKDEGFVFGVAANIFKIAGPVITYGIIASVLCGIVFLFL